MKKRLKTLGLWLVNVLMAAIYFVALVGATVIVGGMYIVASILILIWQGVSWCWYRLGNAGVEPAP
jgi:hypothetical protein